MIHPGGPVNENNVKKLIFKVSLNGSKKIHTSAAKGEDKQLQL